MMPKSSYRVRISTAAVLGGGGTDPPPLATSRVTRLSASIGRAMPRDTSTARKAMKPSTPTMPSAILMRSW